MKYIILNGIHSDTVQGIEIYSLPEIERPGLRIQVEEIEGLSGELVTPVGYAAYKKTFQFKITNGANLDDITDFLKTEGIVIFSNEPDKYYRYFIADPIVYEEITTVEMRIQPFKYSVGDGIKEFFFNTQLIYLSNGEKIENGLTITKHDNKITVKGQAIIDSEILVPLARNAEVVPGLYELTVYCDGKLTSGSGVQVIKSGNDFSVLGGLVIPLEINKTDTRLITIPYNEYYNYLFLNFIGGYNYNFTIEVVLNKKVDQVVSVVNHGNVSSKPRMTIHGSGTINLELNGNSMLDINLLTNDYIVIDTEVMEAYTGNTLRNRSVKGDYEDFWFKPGKNKITISGNVYKIEIENFSRWI